MTDVWELESQNQKAASDLLGILYQNAIGGSTYARNLIKQCFEGDSWKTIRERMDTEGSVWYVWYSDGVNRFMEFCDFDEV